jgi:hypothetical protein
MTRRPCRPAERATDREVGVVAAVLVAGSEKAAAHHLGLSHSTVKSLMRDYPIGSMLLWRLGPGVAARRWRAR